MNSELRYSTFYRQPYSSSLLKWPSIGASGKHIIKQDHLVSSWKWDGIMAAADCDPTPIM